jgi:threonine synthase
VTVIASTASPYKFTRSVMNAITDEYKDLDDFALADKLVEISGVKLPRAVEEIRSAKVLHDRVVDAVDMPQTVKEILGMKK